MFEDALMESWEDQDTPRLVFRRRRDLQRQHRMPAGVVASAASRISAETDTQHAAGGSGATCSAAASYAARGKRRPRAAALVNPFTPPLIIPNRIASTDHEPPPAIGTGITPLARESGGLFNGLPDSIGTATPPQVRVTPSRKPVISSGVMEGRKLSGAEPRYPTIAVAARVQGTVVLAATISKTGAIENLRVVSGPPMLAPAAEEAVRTWRYRPYLLNGEPVEVETTVRVIFNLGG